MSLTGREARYFESLGRLFEQGRIRKDKTMYKDKDRQRQAVREATRRWREGITNKAESVIPCDTPAVIPYPWQTKPEPQSHNSMMEGYVPPT